MDAQRVCRFAGTWIVRCTALLLMSTAAGASMASVVINEVDYDQPGSDHAEFIELFNAGTAEALDGFVLSLINGGTGTPYRSIALPAILLPGNGYFVICGDPTQVLNCDLDVSPDSNLIQNGAPDAIALRSDTQLLDSISYEGDIAGFTEGSSSAAQDNNVDAYLSLARLPNGTDSDRNQVDFGLACSTPGYSNLGFTGACTPPRLAAARGTVDEPPTSMLLGLGILVIAARGVHRRAERGTVGISGRRAMQPRYR